MEINVAMLIMGSVLLVVGVVMNIIPIKFNEAIFGNIESDAVNAAAAMRTNIGSALIAMGVIILLNRNVHDVNESKELVFSFGVGILIFLLSIILGYFRKFTKNIPTPPVIILGSLIAIAFYSSSGSQVSNVNENILDAVTLDPDHYTVEFENDKVRVLRIKYGPGEKSVMHDHPESVVVVLNDQKGKFTLPGGESFTANPKAGSVFWTNAARHLPENIGADTTDVLQIELKTN